MDPKDLPESFFAGQEYLEDQLHDLMRVELCFYTPAVLDPFEFYVQKKKVVGSQNSGVLKVTFDVDFPRKLIDDLAWGRGNSQAYVLGYISRYLPRINEEMLRQRYSSGHFLLRTFSPLDVFKITITNLKPEWADEVINVPWPPTFAKFPPAQMMQGTQMETYLKDFVDAGNDYLRGDYDNCIRRVITSAENAFRFYRLDKTTPSGWRLLFISLPFFKETSFNTIARSISSPNHLGSQVVSENLLFLYKLRNRIVHNKFRIRFENGWVARRAFATLNYLYQFLDRGGKVAAYVSFMEGQMMMLDMELRGTTMERLRVMHKESKKEHTPEQFISNDKQMNEWMYGNLRIKKQEQNIILNNKVPPGFYKY